MTALGFHSPSGRNNRAALLLFSSINEAAQTLADRVDSPEFWTSVCEGSRWILTADRLAITQRDGGGVWRWAARAVDGRYDATGCGDAIPDLDRFGRALSSRFVRWLDVDDHLQRNSFVDWLTMDDSQLLLVVPLRSRARSSGAMVFACSGINPDDRRLLQCGATTYGLHLNSLLAQRELLRRLSH